MQALIDSLNRLTDVLDKLTSTKGSNLRSINININFSNPNDSTDPTGTDIEMPTMPEMPKIEIPEEMLNEEF